MVKRRSPGDGGLYYDKAKNLWRGVVDIGFTPEGKRKQKAVTSRTQKGARDKLDELKKEILTHGSPLDKSVTVAKWAEHWLETVCRPTLKPQPMSSYQSMVRRWVIPTIGRKKVASVQPSDIRSVYAAIGDAGLSSSTAKSVHRVMSVMFESAFQDGKAPRNVMRSVKAPQGAVSTRGAIPTPDALKILSEASRDVDGTRWWVALLAGMRQGERIGATLDSLDLDSGLFTVQWSLTEATFQHGCADDDPCGKKRGGACPDRRLRVADGLDYRQLDGRLCLVRPKSGKIRTFPIIPQLAEALRRYLEETKERPNPHGLIWRNADGSPLTPGQDADAWRSLLRRARIITEAQALRPKERPEGTPEPPTPHWARHTTVTILASLGVDLQIIGQIVGHVDEETTQRYRHVATAEAKHAMAQLGQHLAKGLEA